MSSVAALVLAAGASTRMGSPKQLAVLNGEILLNRAVRVAREAGLSPVVVVLGALAFLIEAKCTLGDAVVVVNQVWAEGMGGSVRVGVEVLKDAEGVVLMTCDQPAVTVRHLEAIAGGDEVRASRYAGRNGVPAYFPARYFERLMALRGDVGARELLVGAVGVDLMGGELDVDTVEDLVRARELFG